MLTAATPRTKVTLTSILAVLALVVVLPVAAQADMRAVAIKAQPHAARSGGFDAIKLYNGNVLVAGGNAGDGTTDTYEIFNPTADSGHGSWTTYTGMNGSNYANFNHYYKGKFIDLGGVHHKVMLIAQNTTNPTVDGPITSQIFDPVDGTWSTAVDTGMPYASIFDCAASTDGVVACYASESWSGTGLKLYDRTTDTWAAHGLPNNNGLNWIGNHVGSPQITGLASGKFLTVNASYCCTWNNSAVFDSNADTWTNSGNMPSNYVSGGETWLLPDGNVLMAGGLKNDHYGNDMSYLWNHTSGQWTENGRISGNDNVTSSTGLSGSTFDKDGNPIFVSDGVVNARYDVAAGVWDYSSYRAYNRWTDAKGSLPGVPVTLDDGRTIVFGGGPVYDGRPQDRTWDSKTYIYANVPTLTGAIQIENSGNTEYATIGTTVSATSDGVWDTEGLTLNKRWQLCKNNDASCVDVPGGTGSSYTITLQDFIDHYSAIRRVETVDDRNVGEITNTSMRINITGPPAPSAEPDASVDFSSSDEYTPGTVLHRTKAVWTGRNIGSVTSKWERCGDFGDGWACTDLPDAPTYTVTQDDIDHNVQINYTESVTDDLDQTSTTTKSGYINAITGPRIDNGYVKFLYPHSRESNRAPVGSTLRVAYSDNFAWTRPPSSLSYEWSVYDDNTGDWTVAEGATGTSFSTANLGRWDGVKVCVTATADGLTGEPACSDDVWFTNDIFTAHASLHLNTNGYGYDYEGDKSGLRMYGARGTSISEAHYYTTDNDYYVYDGAWSTWVGETGSDALFSASTNPNDFTPMDGGVEAAPATVKGLDMSVKLRTSSMSDIFAKVVKLTNNTGAPLSRTISEAMDLGSGDSSILQGQSTGGTEYDQYGLNLDRSALWFVTANTLPSDGLPWNAVNTSVFGGPGAAVAPSLERDGGAWGVNLEVTIPAGETRYLLYFGGLGSMIGTPTNDPADAVTNAQALFNSTATLPPDLLDDIPSGDRSKVLNWQFGAPVVAPTLTFNRWSRTASGVASITVGGPVGAKIQVSNYANFRKAVTLTVGQSGSIKTLAKRLGAGQVRLHYRIKWRPSSAATTTAKYDFKAPFISKNSVHWAKTVKGTWNIHMIARDKTCPGCDPKLTVQLAYGNTAPASTDPFPTTLTRDVFTYKANKVIKTPTPPRWVRVTDSKGNVTAWRALVGAPVFPEA
ncbi:MAG: hypothetical protein F2799_08210 [Actinobacteria bacterium]|uniref:Unannotated protein n=1 Tax=freshwater metagenome TaxID=449393 RepID=A0A6J7EPN3_9ZZZZ|nr:hypothetical protein [Actinomycetota bacterium]